MESQLLVRGTRERNDGSSPEAGRGRTGSVGPVTKLRETPGTTTGGTKKLRRATGKREVARPGLQAGSASWPRSFRPRASVDRETVLPMTAAIRRNVLRLSMAITEESLTRHGRSPI